MSKRSESDQSRLLIRRVHIVQAVTAAAILLLSGFLTSPEFVTSWWLWTSITTTTTVAVLEPNFTGPYSALLVGIAYIAAGLAANRQGVELLWWILFLFSSVVLIASTLSVILNEGSAQSIARWVSSRLGRPLWLGSFAVAIELIRLTSSVSLSTVSILAAGCIVSLVVVVPDWYRLLILSRPGLNGLVTIESAVEPNLILFATNQQISKGTRVRVDGIGSAEGIVIGNLAHKTGIALKSL